MDFAQLTPYQKRCFVPPDADLTDAAQVTRRRSAGADARRQPLEIGGLLESLAQLVT